MNQQSAFDATKENKENEEKDSQPREQLQKPFAVSGQRDKNNPSTIKVQWDVNLPEENPLVNEQSNNRWMYTVDVRNTNKKRDRQHNHQCKTFVLHHTEVTDMYEIKVQIRDRDGKYLNSAFSDSVFVEGLWLVSLFFEHNVLFPIFGVFCFLCENISFVLVFGFFFVAVFFCLAVIAAPIEIEVSYINGDENSKGKISFKRDESLKFKQFKQRIVDKLKIPSDIKPYPLKDLIVRLLVPIENNRTTYVDLGPLNFGIHFKKHLRKSQDYPGIRCEVGWEAVKPSIVKVEHLKSDATFNHIQVCVDTPAYDRVRHEFVYEMRSQNCRNILKSGTIPNGSKSFELSIQHKRVVTYRGGSKNSLTSRPKWGTYSIYLAAVSARDNENENKNDEEYIHVILIAPKCAASEYYCCKGMYTSAMLCFWHLCLVFSVFLFFCFFLVLVHSFS